MKEYPPEFYEAPTEKELDEIPTKKEIKETTITTDKSNIKPDTNEKHPDINKESLFKMLKELEELIKVTPPYRHWDEKTRNGIIDSWQKTINEFSENEWKTYISDNYNELSPKFSTGSNSGSLIGFSELRGLTPIGQILREHPKQVPYSGELFLGASKEGVNQKSLSFTSNTDTAINYAEKPKFNTTGWNPQISEQKLSFLKTEINQLEKNQTPSERYKGRDLFQEKLDALKLNIEIEKRRQQLWIELNETERSFISNPFPLVYGILKTEDMNEDYYEEHHGDIQGEFKHPGHLSIDNGKSGQFVLYCPAEKINTIQEYLKQKNISLPIHPLEATRECQIINKFFNLIEESKKRKQTLTT